MKTEHGLCNIKKQRAAKRLPQAQKANYGAKRGGGLYLVRSRPQTIAYLNALWQKKGGGKNTCAGQQKS